MPTSSGLKILIDIKTRLRGMGRYQKWLNNVIMVKRRTPQLLAVAEILLAESCLAALNNNCVFLYLAFLNITKVILDLGDLNIIYAF